MVTLKKWHELAEHQLFIDETTLTVIYDEIFENSEFSTDHR